MTSAEAKQAIKDEYIKAFYQYLDDEKNLTKADFARKYGFLVEEGYEHKANLKGIEFFQRHCFDGRTRKGWEKAGYDIRAIWALKNEGFLYEFIQQRASDPTLYCISQTTAKQILREHLKGEKKND